MNGYGGLLYFEIVQIFNMNGYENICVLESPHPSYFAKRKTGRVSAGSRKRRKSSSETVKTVEPSIFRSS